MESKTGIVSNIKIIKMSERPLIYFRLDDCNCLIAGRSLSFLADVSDGMKITVAGYKNCRKQFIVQKYCTIGKTRLMLDIETIQNKETVFV